MYVFKEMTLLGSFWIVTDDKLLVTKHNWRIFKILCVYKLIFCREFLIGSQGENEWLKSQCRKIIRSSWISLIYFLLYLLFNELKFFSVSTYCLWVFSLTYNEQILDLFAFFKKILYFKLIFTCNKYSLCF